MARYVVVSVSELVCKGEELLVHSNGTPVSRVTVDSERVLQECESVVCFSEFLGRYFNLQLFW